MSINKLKNTLLVVGNLGGRKGLPAILDALLVLKNTGIRVLLRCVGNVDDDLENILESSNSYEFVKDQVVFTGFLKLPEAYAEIENCFAGLALPEEIENHQESHSTKIFEYMFLALPVVASDFPANRDVINKCNCGILANADDAEEIADAISYLYQNPLHAEKMGENGRKCVEENYNWQTEEVKLLQLYTKIAR